MTLPGRQVTGVRRVLDRAADRALAAGPPTRAQEAWYVASWLGALDRYDIAGLAAIPRPDRRPDVS